MSMKTISGKNRFNMVLCLTALACLTISCLETDKADRTLTRTVLVYIAGDNNLSNMANSNIYSMNGNISNGTDNTKLIAFVDRKDVPPALLHIHDGYIDTIFDYNREKQELDTSDPMVLRDVIEYVHNRYKSESYGLVLWSHGTGWIPTSQLHFVGPNMKYVQGRDGDGFKEGLRDPFAPYPETKAFTWEDRKGQKPAYSCMDLDELVEAIPEGIFDFIAFDACYMGCTEVIYALRNKADYIISSCYEIVSYGFPYHIVTHDYLSGNLMKVCREFFVYYNSMTGWERMAGVSLVKTSELDSLARCFSKIVSGYRDTIPVMNVDDIQVFDRFKNHVMYDLEDFVDKLEPDKEDLTEFRLQMERCVPYKISTPYIFQGDREQIKVNTYCGLSIYIPISKYDSCGLNDDYRKTDWSRDTGFGVRNEPNEDNGNEIQ